jgi:hypothetical protein
MLAWSSAPDDPITTSAPNNNYSAYPTPDVYKDTFSNDHYYDPPKKKVDAIAEAWGMHEPEPFEDFSAGGGSSKVDGDTPSSSIYNGREGHRTVKRSKEGRDMREVYREYLDEGQKEARRGKRSTLPPPQPIFVPDANHPEVLEAPPLLSPPLGSPGVGGAPKRNKSLMQRFRKMRDSPNVPLGNHEEEGGPPSPTNAENSYYPYSASPTRPTHRQKDSFLGRLGGGGNNNPKENISPVSDGYDQGKELPATPFGRDGRSTSLGDQEAIGYFDERVGSSNGYGSPNGGQGRTTTILRKVKGVVKGGK